MEFVLELPISWNKHLKARGLLKLSRNQPTGLCFRPFAMIHMRDKQGILSANF